MAEEIEMFLQELSQIQSILLALLEKIFCCYDSGATGFY